MNSIFHRSRVPSPTRFSQHPPGHPIGGFAHEVHPSESSSQSTHGFPHDDPSESESVSTPGVTARGSWPLEEEQAASGSELEGATSDSSCLLCFLGTCVLWVGSLVFLLLYLPLHALAWFSYFLCSRGTKSQITPSQQSSADSPFVHCKNKAGEDRCEPPQVGCL